VKTFLLSILLTFGAVAMAAGDGSIRIENPRAAETPPGAKTGAVYLDIVNAGNADRLLGVEASDVAGHTELHTTALEGNMMRMRKLEAIDLASGATVSLEPGDLHIMLIDLKKQLLAGQNFPLVLRFEKAGAVQVSVPVQKREQMTESAPHQDHDHSGHAGHARP